MSNGRPVICPASLALTIVARNIAQLERRSVPDPDTARALLRLARQVELDTGEESWAVAWLVGYIAACATVKA